MKTFLLVMSIWGYDGYNWVFSGYEMVLKEPMSIEQCGAMVEHWTARPGNTYLRVHIGCEEVSIVEESNAPREM